MKTLMSFMQTHRTPNQKDTCYSEITGEKIEPKDAARGHLIIWRARFL
jgi:hypothetical protein